MRKKAIKWLPLVLTLVFLLALLPGTAMAAGIVASGECGDEGDNLTWTLDSDGVLTISGTGGMYYDDYYDHESGYYDPSVGGNPDEMPNPWLDYSLDIKRVILHEGMENVTEMAFAGFENLTEVNIPKSVTNIGMAAFMLTSLVNIVLPEGLSYLAEGLFSECTKMESVYIPDSVQLIESWVFYHCYALTDIYYGGDQAAWNSIEIWDDTFDIEFDKVTVHFNCERTTAAEEPAEPITPEEPVAPDEPNYIPFDPNSFADIASWNVRVSVDGNFVSWADAPYIDANDRTMASFQEISEALGLYTDWDSTTGVVSFSDGTTTIYFPVGSVTAKTENGGKVEMDTTAAIYDDQPYVPVRYVAEYFGRSVNWDLSTRIVAID